MVERIKERNKVEQNRSPFSVKWSIYHRSAEWGRLLVIIDSLCITYYNNFRNLSEVMICLVAFKEVYKGGYCMV